MSGSVFFLVCVCGFYVVCIFSLIDIARAKNTTDSEVAALNYIFQQWGVTSASDMGWNISGEPCSGTAIDSTDFDDPNYNPFIKCECSYNNGSTCHITKLKVYRLDAIGVIPDELWNLTFLDNLNLANNYLTGPLSASIGNLTRMQYLSVAANALSGELPKELGKLTDLRSLAFGSNNFSGPLPSELGNLVKLEQIYFDSSGVSGEIPSTFANLQNLDTVWGSDTELTGRMPDFIGNWSKLTTLRLQGNSFEGPIPSALSNLTFLTELRISDVSNGSSSLEFIKDMKSLSILVLRNDGITDSIPSNIGEYQSLSQLDLSFNNLTGQIPVSLFNLSLLSHLFIGNNMLTGTLPSEKSASLLNIDLSYNELSGSFPSWVNPQNMELNLVANNFTIDDSNSSVLPGLRCLQRNFPCNRGSGLYYDFAIKSGGPQITSSSGIVFERDNETLGAASYFVTDANRWAVSNVGLFAGSNDPQYTSFSSSQFTNTLDLELFQTARLSAGSLRYYGLGLENGNYTVTLQFAETAIEESTTWKSLGRRVFDIYMQGLLNDGRVVAVKQLSVASHHGKNQFVTEIATISAVQHRNLVKLYGCCIEGDQRLLVYEFLENKSLDQALFGNRSLELNWPMRYDICLGVARGLAYLHEESRLRIVHRDVKASNILLDYDLNPKISDFGLAKLYDDKKTHISTRVAGTIGYLAPEYAMRGHLTEKADVFGFGVVALEIVSGRPNSDTTLEEDKMYLLEWAWNLHESGHEIELVDSTLSDVSEKDIKRMIGIALLCTQTSPALRPPMSRVVAMLSGDIEVGTITTRPGYLTDWKFNDVLGFTSDSSNQRTDTSNVNSSASTSVVADAEKQSTPESTKALLHEIIGEGM